MQACPHDRQQDAQTAVYGTSLQILCCWALHLPGLLQNLLQVLHAQPNPNPVHLKMTTPVPVTLPTCQLPADYEQRHVLHAVNKHLAPRAPFSQQLAESRPGTQTPSSLTGQAACTAHLPGTVLRSISFCILGTAIIIIKCQCPQCSFPCPLPSSSVSAHNATFPVHCPYLSLCELSHSC